MSPQRTEFEIALAALGDRVPNSIEYQKLCEIALTHRLTPKLLALDPFSVDYKATVLQIYHDLRGSDDPYIVEQDEKSGLTMPQNLFSDVSPWNFRDTGLVSEFLVSWGQIMRALALPPGSNAKILEYGSGSGQLLLFLSRLGFQTSAVDIDVASLELVRAQANRMQLDIRTEQAAFGSGFDDETFDRIIFFEAFHHALDFGSLLIRLRQRLSPNGLLILCGEPIVGEYVPSVPYPWGPRLDGLSVFCIRRYGWMELGFTVAFLIEAFHRHGWLVEVQAVPNFGRATTYVAKPYVGNMVEVGKQVSLGPHETGWEGFEDTHRWTRGDQMATFPLPDQAGGPSRVTIRVTNPFPFDISVKLYDGDQVVRHAVIPGNAESVDIVIGPCYHAFIGIRSSGLRPIDVWPTSSDTRKLGVMVRGVRVDQTLAPPKGRAIAQMAGDFGAG